MIYLQGTLFWHGIKSKERFDPQTSHKKLQLKEKFTNSKSIDWRKSLDDWIMELEIIASQLDQMCHKITNKDFMIHVLGNLPEEYKSKLETLTKDLDHQYENKLNMNSKVLS